MTPQEKAIKYDEMIRAINEFEKMWTESLQKYPSLKIVIESKLEALKLIKM
jgi:hypothetical protein